MIETTGKLVNGTIDALKSSPVTLAMVLMNVALLALVAFIIIKADATRAREVELIYKMQDNVQKLLATCGQRT